VAVNFISWARSVSSALIRIERNQEAIMATYTEAKQEWVDYTKALQDENAALRNAVTTAEAAAQANADALQAFQDDDAATDAQQLADAAQAIADDLHSTLESVKTPPVEPAPLPEEPPVDEPHPDQTLPGDL
jgi:hypothetical protein